jgi:protein TonB
MQKNTHFLFLSLILSFLSYAQVTESISDTAIVTTPTLDAEYNGGFEALAQYITANIEGVSNPKKKRSVPKEDLFEGGRVIVRFIIEKDGTVSNVVLEERLRKCEPCNREAIRVVKNMPKWKPGLKNGKAVRTYVRLPIRFVVD